MVVAATDIIFQKSVPQPNACFIFTIANNYHSFMANREIPKVSIITVTYNSSHVVKEMLDSLSAYSNAEVILVDNGSSDIQKIQTLADKYDVRLISNQENKGFGTACNQGAKMAKFDLLLFLNPDTIISETALNTFLYSTIKYPNASAFNPAMYDSKGNQSFKRSRVCTQLIINLLYCS